MSAGVNGPAAERESLVNAAEAARKVGSALLALAEACEGHDNAFGPREDHWSTGYPAQRDMTEEAYEWFAYADTVAGEGSL